MWGGVGAEGADHGEGGGEGVGAGGGVEGDVEDGGCVDYGVDGGVVIGTWWEEGVSKGDDMGCGEGRDAMQGECGPRFRYRLTVLRGILGYSDMMAREEELMR